MKVNRLNTYQSFIMLSCGDLFRTQDGVNIYMKVSESNCVNVETGTLIDAISEQQVIKVDGELNVKG